MMKGAGAGLITLADLPALAGGKNPRSQITVARLGKYQDSRYGKFEISEADYDGWKRNLSDTFGGKVSVDFDHSSDRGRGTEAAAWITGLERQGKDVIASVEWTPKGARAVRNKSYQFISPTFTNNFRDEYGVDRGRALLGAACTNRPVLRQLPTLSLSRDAFEGVATPRKKAKKTMSQKKKTVTLSPKKIRKLTLAAGYDPAEVRLMTKSNVDPELRRMWLGSLAPRDVRTLAMSSGSAPLGMDTDRFTLHTQAKQLAQARVDANPGLDEADAYCLAAIELEDRKYPGVI